MDISSVSTNVNVTPSFNPQSHPSATQGTQTQTVQAVKEPQAVERTRADVDQAARTTLNAQGQKVGTRINEMA